ncbi:MAG: DUF748 domain-containing protein [Thermodesulfobacteriota bacterium]
MSPTPSQDSRTTTALGGGPPPVSPGRRRTPNRRIRRHPWHRGLSVAALFVLLAGLGLLGLGLAVPWLLTQAGPPRLAGLLRQPVSLDYAAFDPLALRLRLTGGRIGAPAAAGRMSALAFRSLVLELDWRSVLAGRPRTRLELDDLRLACQQQPSGTILPAIRLPSGQDRLPLPWPLPALGELAVRHSRLTVLPAQGPEGLVLEIEELALAGLGSRRAQGRLAASLAGRPLTLTTLPAEPADPQHLLFRGGITGLDLGLLSPLLPAGRRESGSWTGQADLDLVCRLPLAPGRLGSLSLAVRARLGRTAISDRQGRPWLTAAAGQAMVDDWRPLAAAWRLARLDWQEPQLQLPAAAAGDQTALDAAHKALPAAVLWAGTVADEVHLQDGSLLDPGGQAILSHLHLGLRGLRADPAAPAEVTLAAGAEAGLAVTLTGEVRRQPFRLAADLAASGLPLAMLVPGPDDAGPRVTGAATATGHLTMTAGSDGQPFWQLADLTADLADLTATRAGQAWLHLPAARMENGRLGSDGILDLGDLAAQGGDLTLDWRPAAGSLASGEDPWPACILPGWRLQGQSLTLSPAAIRVLVSDSESLPPWFLEAATLELGPLSASGGTPMTLRVAGTLQGGRLRLEGETDPSLASGRFRLEVADLDLAARPELFAGWWRPGISQARLDAQGELSVSPAAAGGRICAFAGQARLGPTATAAAGPDGPLLAWQEGVAEGIVVHSRPPALAISRLAIRAPRLQWPASTTGSAATGLFPPPAAAPQLPVTVSHLEVEDGTLTVTDQRLEPALKMTVEGLSASADNLTRQPGAVTGFFAQGRLAPGAALRCQGQITRPEGGPELAGRLEVTDWDLAALAPWVERELPLAVAGARAEMTVSFGARPDGFWRELSIAATGLELHPSDHRGHALPLPLALALWTDAEGVTRIPVAVRTIAGQEPLPLVQAALRAARSQVLKAAVSPFALLPAGGLDSDDPSARQRVGFAPGAALLDDIALAQLTWLGEMLAGRPRLLLTVRGLADPEQDRAAPAAQEGPAPRRRPIGEPELIRLAEDRAEAVRTFLLEVSGLPPERLRRLPALLAATATGGVSGCRAELVLTLTEGP